MRRKLVEEKWFLTLSSHRTDENHSQTKKDMKNEKTLSHAKSMLLRRGSNRVELGFLFKESQFFWAKKMYYPAVGLRENEDCINDVMPVFSSWGRISRMSTCVVWPCFKDVKCNEPYAPCFTRHQDGHWDNLPFSVVFTVGSWGSKYLTLTDLWSWLSDSKVLSMTLEKINLSVGGG